MIVIDEIIKLDLQKDYPGFERPRVMRVRRGDARSMRRTYQICDYGEPVDLTGASVTFMARVGDRVTMVEVEGAGASGMLEFTLPGSLAVVEGTVSMAYFRVAYARDDGTEVVASTNQLTVVVLGNVDLTDDVTGDYVPMLDRLIEAAENAEANYGVLADEALAAIADARRAAAEADEREAERMEAENGREAAEQAREEAEAMREEAEGLRELAEQAREEAERVRAIADALRDQAEEERARAEQARSDAEALRQAAEADRRDYEDSRRVQESARALAEIERETKFAEMMLSAQSVRFVVLREGEFDPDTLEPTIDGEQGVEYFVPNAAAEEGSGDAYAEWKLLLLTDGTERWERTGSGGSMPDVVTADDVEEIVSGGEPKGLRYLSLAGLRLVWAKAAAAFAPIVHAHGSDGILDGAVTGPKIAALAVGASHIADAAVSSAKIAAGAGGSAALAAAAVTTSKIADGNVTAGKLADAVVSTAKLAAKAVTSAKIADGAVGTAQLAASAVDSSKIKDGSIVNADIANTTIAFGKLDAAAQKRVTNLEAFRDSVSQHKTSETSTGQTWIDGRVIYRKVIALPACAAGQSKETAHGAAAKIILRASAVESSGRHVPAFVANGVDLMTAWSVGLSVNRSVVQVSCGTSTTFDGGWAIIEYVK